MNSENWRMDEACVDRIFAGSLIDLPPVSSKIVRIFTSSTFTDMLMERNTLMEYVYPKIKEYCREKHGLEFQVKLSCIFDGICLSYQFYIIQVEDYCKKSILFVQVVDMRWGVRDEMTNEHMTTALCMTEVCGYET